MKRVNSGSCGFLLNQRHHSSVMSEGYTSAAQPDIKEILIMFPLHSPKQNRILAALPREDYGRLFPYLEFISMPLGKIIYEPGSPITHVYFPTTSIVAPLYGVENGASVQLSIIGNEGTHRYFVPFRRRQHACRQWWCKARVDGYRVKASALKKEFDSERQVTAPGIAFYPGADYSNSAERCLQPAP